MTTVGQSFLMRVISQGISPISSFQTLGTHIYQFHIVSTPARPAPSHPIRALPSIDNLILPTLYRNARMLLWTLEEQAHNEPYNSRHTKKETLCFSVRGLQMHICSPLLGRQTCVFARCFLKVTTTYLCKGSGGTALKRKSVRTKISSNKML